MAVEDIEVVAGFVQDIVATAGYIVGFDLGNMDFESAAVAVGNNLDFDCRVEGFDFELDCTEVVEVGNNLVEVGYIVGLLGLDFESGNSLVEAEDNNLGLG